MNDWMVSQDIICKFLDFNVLHIIGYPSRATAAVTLIIHKHTILYESMIL